MKIWAVTYIAEVFPDELYQHALLALDHDSAATVKKFHRRQDACRCLIGRLLRNMVLYDHGIDPRTARFSLTETGKPYIAHPILDPPIAYNVAHDNGLVAIAFSTNAYNPPAYAVGIDIMKVSLPGRGSFAEFIDTMSETLTPLEYQQIITGKSDKENLQCFFWAWTMKEAYTKALGFGLGFNFRRIEFDSMANLLRVDGVKLTGWRFVKFIIDIDGDDYQGVVAEYLGGDDLEVIHASTESSSYPKKYDATAFITQALGQLCQS